jgi:hypothetical protein
VAIVFSTTPGSVATGTIDFLEARPQSFPVFR